MKQKDRAKRQQRHPPNKTAELSEQTIDETQQRLQAIFNYTQDAIMLADNESRYIDANPAACALLGYSREELLRLTILDITPAPNRELATQAWQAFITAGERSGEFTVLCKDGSLIEVEFRAVANIVPDVHVSVLRNITERRQADAALRESEERYRLLVEHSPDAIGIHADGKVIFANPALVNLMGASTAAQLIGKPIIQFMHPDYLEQIRERLHQVNQNSPTAAAEMKAVRLDGTVICIESVAIPITYLGQPAVQFVARNITARKQAEEKLRKSEQQLAEAQRLAHLGSWHWDIRSNVVTWSDELYRVFGLKPQQFGATYEAFLERVHPDDREFAMETVETAYRERQSFSYTCRLIRPDGEIRVLYSIGDVTVDEMGQPVQMFGIGWDITEREQAEEALRRSIQELELAYHQSVIYARELRAEVVKRKQLAEERLQLLEAERYARQIAETLHSANVALIQSLDLNIRLNFLLEYLAKLVPYDSASILLLESETRLVVRAVRGYEGWTDPELAIQNAFNPLTSPTFSSLLTTRKSVLIADTATHPHWEWRPGAEHVRNWLGVPLIATGNVIGLYSLDKAEPNFFTPEHVRLAEILALQGGMAILNAHLFEQVRSGRQRLEVLSLRLLEVQEAERRHIARELHDEIGQLLTGLKLILEMSLHLPENEIKPSLGEMQQLINDLMVRVRSLSLELRPAMLDDLGLLPALLWLFERYTAQSQIQVKFEHFGLERRFRPEVETAAYRLVQEALTNVARHAQVDEVFVHLAADQERLTLQIEDKGRGFEAEAASAARVSGGLSGMRERVVLLGGHLTIESAPNSGACLTAKLPLCD